MRRLTLAAITALLALPASALAANGNGVVLSVDAKHRTIEVVDSHHVVHAFHYRGRLPKLHAGTKIHFRQSQNSIQGVTVSAKGSRTVSFLGKVVRSSTKGLVVRLADGKNVSFSAKQVHRSKVKVAKHRTATVRRAADASASSVTISIAGLQAGVTVLITETVDDHGNVSITIAFPDGSTLSTEQQASGTINEVDTDAFLLQTADGSVLRLHMATDALNNLDLQVCDTADVTYHQDAGMLIADTVDDNGTSNSGDCAGGVQQSQDEVGTITAVSPDGLTISTQDQGSMTFVVDSPDITDGFQVGDVVDVSYADNGDGTLDANDVEYVEQDASGTVTAVSGGSVTITPDGSDVSQTFTADPGQGLFDGVAVGDQVDINYHQSGGQSVVDSVDDQS